MPKKRKGSTDLRADLYRDQAAIFRIVRRGCWITLIAITVLIVLVYGE